MKKIITILIVLQITFSFAQGRQGSQRPQGGMQNAPNRQAMKFEASKFAGIIKYDSDKVLKKLKIKKEDSISLSVTKLIENFNHNIEEIGLLNKDLFDGLDLIVNESIKSGANNQEARFEIREMIKEKLMPVRDSIKKQDEKLDQSLKTLLADKQFEKWKKYQKLEKEKLMPQSARQSRPRSRNRSSSNMGRRGRGRF